MTDFDEGETLADRFRAHAGDNTHLYAYALRGMADDWETGGPVRQVCAGWEDSPRGSVVQLRVLAGLFRLVLTDQAPQLVSFYACLGGESPPHDAWPVMLEVIGSHVDALRVGLEVAPQTNEIGRSAALLAGIFDLVRETQIPQIRLLEVGASAGLNLLLDHFAFSGEGWRHGRLGSPVQLDGAIEGAVAPVPFSVVSAQGCDLAPVDATTPEGQLLLTSFVWPFDLHRHARLAAVLPIAVQHPPVVDRASAGDWLATQLATPRADDELTVVWQSITQMYWPASEIDRVDAILQTAGAQHRLAHVAMEYHRGGTAGKPEVTTTLWRPESATPVREIVLGTAHDHGIPVRLAAPFAWRR